MTRPDTSSGRRPKSWRSSIQVQQLRSSDPSDQDGPEIVASGRRNSDQPGSMHSASNPSTGGPVTPPGSTPNARATTSQPCFSMQGHSDLRKIACSLELTHARSKITRQCC